MHKGSYWLTGGAIGALLLLLISIIEDVEKVWYIRGIALGFIVGTIISLLYNKLKSEKLAAPGWIKGGFVGAFIGFIVIGGFFLLTTNGYMTCPDNIRYDFETGQIRHSGPCPTWADGIKSLINDIISLRNIYDSIITLMVFGGVGILIGFIIGAPAGALIDVIYRKIKKA